MSSTPPPPATAAGSKSLIPVKLGEIWKSIWAYIPSPDSSFLAKLSNLSRRRSSTVRRRYGYRKSGLPLPLHSSATRSNLIADEPSRAFVILEDIIEDTLCKMHKIQKSLLFWQSRADGSDARKIYFMIFERGPKAFLDSSWEMLGRIINDGYPLQNLSHAASDTISCNIAALTSIKDCLSSFLAQVYLEVGKHGKLLAEDADKSLPLLLVIIDSLFTKLEASIVHPPEIYKGNNILSSSGDDSFALIFQKLPKIDPERSQWADTEIEDATNMIYQNLERLDSYLSFILSSCQKPKRLTLYWVRYTCGAVGLSLCSVWLLRHSSLMGSPDIDNWIREAKESAVAFVQDHVEQPLISIRDELFETFRRRHKGVMEVEEVKLTADSLHRMLLAFCEQTKGQKLPADIADQEMLEIVMGRYEKEVMHPLQNLLSGELARAMLIQIQKLKLDLETAMLELDQILKANEINFAILAALPAFFLSLLMLFLVRAWLLQDKSAEGKGKIARKQRRLLLIEVEKKLVLYQICVDQGMNDDAQCMYGMVLYSLDRLYKAVEKHAKDTGEWFSLRQDIVDLAKPDWGITYKLAVTSRLGRMYDCLLPPSSKR